MARIRTIKPEFWTSEQVACVSRDARLLFIGMWSFCDDSGIHPDSSRRIKMEIFPGDDVDDGEICGWMEELVTAGLLESYDANGAQWLRVTGWNHQLIRKPRYWHPLPDGTIPDSYSTSAEPVPHQYDTGSTPTGTGTGTGTGKGQGQGNVIALRSAGAVADAIASWGEGERQKAHELWLSFVCIANLVTAPKGKDRDIVRKGVALEVAAVIPDGSMKEIAEAVHRGKSRKWAYVTASVKGKLEDAGYARANGVLKAIEIADALTNSKP